MIAEYIRLEVGMLLKVEKSFMVKVDMDCGTFTGMRKIKKGQIIELRFQCDWHFRTECNTYCETSADKINANCSFFGNIHQDTRFYNNTKLSEIISKELFHKPSEYKLCKK